MAPSTDKRLFISYSHQDTKLVGSVVSLLRATKASPVFQDVNIAPGTVWRAEIERGVQDAQTVVVFWCRHAQASAEMRKEWGEGITANKEMLPLLLDSTPLPQELARFQWIDFREYGARSHRRLWQSPAALGVASIAFLAAVSLSLLPTMKSERAALEPMAPVEAPKHPAAPEAGRPVPRKAVPRKAPPPPAPDLMDDLMDAPAFVAAGAGLIALAAFAALWRRRKRSKARVFDEGARWPVSAPHHEMADAIIAELSKRPR